MIAACLLIVKFGLSLDGIKLIFLSIENGYNFIFLSNILSGDFGLYLRNDSC